jgi:hypothetical protein
MEVSVDSIRAIAAYKAKCTPARISATFTTLLTPMQNAYATAATAAYLLEQATKATIQGLTGLPTPVESIDFPSYYSFARWVLKKQRRFPGGPQITAEVSRKRTEWISRGLSSTVLEAITTQMGVPIS